MKEVNVSPLFGIQASADGKTVWVHAADGSCVGRFDKRFGLDVHTTASEQINEGKPQCLLCTHEAAGPDDWQRFRAAVKAHHAIEVPNETVTFEAECNPKPRFLGRCP